MKLLPRSLFGRLLALAIVSTVAALLVAGFAIGHVLERVVMRQLDDRLDAQLAVLARAVRPDGMIDPARAIDLPGFDRAGSGWRWQVTSGARTWANAPAAGMTIAPGPPDRFDRHGPRPDEGRDRAGQRLHIRSVTLPGPAGPVLLRASGPRRVVDRPLREAMVPLLGSLALLGTALGAATLLQLRLGLAPVRALRAALAEVTAGRRRHVPGDQPAELAPLAAELNALIDRNATQLAQARGHVANLAHGLKTPLAALAVRLAEEGRDADGALAAMVADIDARIVHHLRRARAAAPGGPGVRTPVAVAVTDLVAVLSRVHPDRMIAVEARVDPALAIAVDAQDLDEMLGNLLDNAWRHAAARIVVSATRTSGGIAIHVEDDGPGLTTAQIDEALIPGRRLDERAPGHGFGLPITRELAELNGGALALDRSPALGGLCAMLTLPAASDHIGA